MYRRDRNKEKELRAKILARTQEWEQTECVECLREIMSDWDLDALEIFAETQHIDA